MRWSDIPFKPPPATLRWFGGTGALLLTGLAARQFFVHGEAISTLALLGAAVGVGAVTLLFPTALRPVFVGWMVLTFPVSWVMSQLILAFVFYCIFTPLGLFFKLIGRDALALRPRGDADTYWTAAPRVDEVRRYFRPS